MGIVSVCPLSTDDVLCLSATYIIIVKMENLRNFVILQIHDGLEIVNKNWRIDDNNFFYPVGVKSRNDYFKLLNTMVHPGYHNDEYEWLPIYAHKIYGSEDAFGKAMSKLESFKYYNAIGESIIKKTRNGNTKEHYPPSEELYSPIFENKNYSSEPVSKLLKFITPLSGSMKQIPPTDPFAFNSTGTDGTKEFSAGNINKNVPTTSTQSSTIVIDCTPKKESDAPVSQLSKRITPFSGTTQLIPFTIELPIKNTTIIENFSGGAIEDNKPATSTQTASSKKNNLTPKLSVSAPPSKKFDPTNILYQKIVSIEKVITGMNLRVSRSLANQEKIINLIEKQNRKTLEEKLVDKVTAEFDNHFNSNFPLRTLEDLLELEKLLTGKQYYKLLRIKLLSYSGADLKSLTVNILKRLFSSYVGAKITMTANSYIKRSPTMDTMNKIKLQNKKIYKLIIDVIMQTFKCDEDLIKTQIRCWLRHVQERNDEVERAKNQLQMH